MSGIKLPENFAQDPAIPAQTWQYRSNMRLVDTTRSYSQSVSVTELINAQGMEMATIAPMWIDARQKAQGMLSVLSSVVAPPNFSSEAALNDPSRVPVAASRGGIGTPALSRIIGVPERQAFRIPRRDTLLTSYQVRATLSPDGTYGANGIVLQVFGRNRAKNGVNNEFYQGLNVQNGNRSFTILEVGESEGYATIRIRANDGRELRVDGGESVDFKNESRFGITVLWNDPNCEDVETKIETTGSVFRDIYVGQYRFQYTWDQLSRRNRPIVGMTGLPGQESPTDYIGELVSEGGDVIGVYMDGVMKQGLLRFAAQMEAAMIYGEYQNFETSAISGTGFVEQIPSSRKINYSPSAYLDMAFLDAIVEAHVAQNPYAGDVLHIACGTLAYRNIQNSLRNIYPVQRWVDQPRTMDEAMQSYVLGYQVNAVYDYLGVKIMLHRITALDQDFIDGRRSPQNPAFGIRSHDIFVLDPQNILNTDYNTGADFDTGYGKIMFGMRTDKDGNLLPVEDHYKNGLTDSAGNLKANGSEVRQFNYETVRRLTYSLQPMLIDPYAASYFSPLN